MKRLLPLAFMFLFCCSKQESTTTETQQAAVPQSTAPAGRTMVTLTPEEVEDVAWAILLKFHDDNLIGDADLMAYIEELSVEGDNILYKLLRHNGNDAGWHSDELEEDNPPYAEDYEEVVEETEEERLQREQQEEYEAEEAEREREYQERYGFLLHPPEQEEQPKWYYENEIDTFTYDASYIAYLEGGTPESPLKTVRIVFVDKMKRAQTPINQGVDEPIDPVETEMSVSSITDVVVELGSPIVVERNRLYLKAKIANLTDQDLAGMTKDELGFLRNEIFARHGHTFKTEKMSSYFGGKRWYHPIDADAAPLLNKFEKRNVEFIKKKEG